MVPGGHKPCDVAMSTMKYAPTSRAASAKAGKSMMRL